MTAPPPRANPFLLGQEAAEATLVEALAAGRLHHGWLLTGPPGVGKATLAYRFARRLLAGPGAGLGAEPGPTLALPDTHPTFRRVAAGGHADLLTVEREWDAKRRRLRGEIVVDDVRRIAAFLHLTPAEAGWRVVVLDGAEDLNRNAANALLKVLEEPPARAVLLLVCNAAGRLLPTIRSRTRRLPLVALEEATLTALLARYVPELDDAARLRLAGLAEGSIGRALQLAAGDAVTVADLVGQVLDTPPSGLRLHEIADAVTREEETFSTFMELLRGAITASVRAAARGRADPDQTRLLGTRPLAAWIDLWQGLTQIQDETEGAHLDRRQAVLSGLTLLADR